MTHHAESAAELRRVLNERGIKEPLWAGFQWSTKMGGSHIRIATIGDSSFKLAISACGRGYTWSFSRQA